LVQRAASLPVADRHGCSAADDNTNPLGWFLSFGIGGNSPIESRPADRFGVG
jgi:hypothetical protein